LIIGYPESPLTLVPTNITFQQNFKTIQFGTDETNPDRVFMYGVANQTVYKWTITVDRENKTWQVSGQISKPEQSYTGNFFDSLVNRNFFVVSCGDCPSPSVMLYDKTTLEFDQSFPVRASNSTVHLASYQESRFHMELYVADYVSIGLIEMMQSTKGNIYFKKTDDIFIMD
jgi:hypothetical protein